MIDNMFIQYGVGGCAICISNKVEYLDNDDSYKNSTKKIINIKIV